MSSLWGMGGMDHSLAGLWMALVATEWYTFHEREFEQVCS